MPVFPELIERYKLPFRVAQHDQTLADFFIRHEETFLKANDYIVVQQDGLFRVGLPNHWLQYLIWYGAETLNAPVGRLPLRALNQVLEKDVPLSNRTLENHLRSQHNYLALIVERNANDLIATNLLGNVELGLANILSNMNPPLPKAEGGNIVYTHRGGPTPCPICKETYIPEYNSNLGEFICRKTGKVRPFK